jgi:HK97 family phage portal protein
MNFGKRVQVAGRAIVETVRFMLGDQKAGTPFVFPAWGGHLGIASLIDYLTYADQGYGKNAIVHACIREISRSAPSARLQVRRRLPNAQTEVWEGHPLQKLLDRPNQHQGQKAFIELYYTYLNIDGNAFIIRVREGRKTKELWLPRPDRMRPVIKDRDLVGYVYVTETGERIPWLADEVIHIKEPNPSDPFEGLGRGLAPLSAAAVETDVDNRATAFMKKFFDNAAVPFGLLKSKNILSDPEVHRIRARIKEQYSGEQNWHEIMILDADAEYQRMGLNLEEMAFTDLRAISETRICAVFKVPPILVGIKAGLDASTYSNYTQARRAMWEDKIIPDNGKLSDELSTDFADELGQDGLITHDYSNVVALQEDRNNRFSRANQGVNGGWITVNEGRREVGLAPVRGGDVFLRPLMSQATTPEGGKGLARVEVPLLPELKGILRKGENAGAWEQWGALIHKRRDRVARAWEMRFLNAAKDRFEAESREIEALLKKFKSRKGQKEILWGDVTSELFGYISGSGQPLWEATFTPLLKGLLDDQGEEWSDELGIDWDFQNPEVQAFLRQYSLKFADQIGATTKEGLRLLLLQAQEEGWQITRLILEVGRLYEGWQTFQRAEMIARSETIRALNAGANEAYRLAGVTEKQWYASLDERSCPFCAQMHEKVIAVESNFMNRGESLTVDIPDGVDAADLLLEYKSVGGDRWAWAGGFVVVDRKARTVTLTANYDNVGFPPLHPNCRCTILPVVRSE